MSVKRYLITGGTGFLGEQLIKNLQDNQTEIVTIARNEGKLIELKQRFPSLQIITGDCADPCIMRKALKGVDAIFHLAAFKHVGLAEEQPNECISSNVIATNTLLQCTDQNKYDFIIAISTDKAAQVAGVYGATKLLMEAQFRQFESTNPQTDYRIVRYGNVLYSTGSVLCKWKALLMEGKPVIVTDPDATRFFWTRNQAIKHIFKCINTAKDCTPFCPEMKSMRVMDLLLAMNEKYGTGKSFDVDMIGLQPGENLHETVDGLTFSDQVEQFSIEEIKELI